MLSHQKSFFSKYASVCIGKFIVETSVTCRLPTKETHRNCFFKGGSHRKKFRKPCTRPRDCSMFYYSFMPVTQLTGDAFRANITMKNVDQDREKLVVARLGFPLA